MVRFADARHGVAVGHGGTVLTSDDAGASWRLRLDGRRVAEIAKAAATTPEAQRDAERLLAEGADGSSMTRTIDFERAMDDCIVAWAMNGEMLRPENGYPLRLVVPGVQGVSWVKYLRRIEVGDAPWGAKDEAIHYVDLMPGGLHRQYSSTQEVKSVVTTPSGGQVPPQAATP